MNEIKTSNKGRKRTKKVDKSNFYEFLVDFIQPKWEDSVSKISMKQRQNDIKIKGIQYAWFEFFKDIRKYYRLVFRYRFHRSEKRDDANKRRLIEIILSDFHFSFHNFVDVEHLFYFFYNVHNKMRKEEGLEDIQGHKFESSNFEVFDNFNPTNVNRFLNDQIGSQLIWFFITNYSDFYLQQMEGPFAEEVSNIVAELKSKFRPKFSAE